MASSAAKHPATLQSIRLELSGPRLSESLARLIAGCEALGSVEQFVQALELKSALFREILGEGGVNARTLEPETFRVLVPFMPTVRRRIGPWLTRPAFEALREDIVQLLEPQREERSVDEQLEAFGGRFCGAERPRWTRDLGAELLHQLSPQRVPLMTRWVWDAAANTGVLREIWFGGEDGAPISVPDSHAMFLTLREELSGFLSGNGIFRDVTHYVDLLCAQVYAEYICAQGGSYLRVDFSAEEDPLQYTRRLLGLDGLKGDARIPRAGSIEVRGTNGSGTSTRRQPD